MKKFNVPLYYHSNIIREIREIREKYDPKKKDISPSIINIGDIDFYIGRHFGFCYGVKNAIEICYQAIKKYPKKKIYLLSQMIHNQMINNDLNENGILFIMDTEGNQLIPWNNIEKNDIVIIPAFGTSLEVLEILKKKQINTEKFNTTCPFVSKVWNRSKQIAAEGYTIIVYGRSKHEETRSTFSRAKKYGPAIIVENIKDVNFLCEFMLGKKTILETYEQFQNKYSKGFNMKHHLSKVGVVNQTTMLASDTKNIIDLFSTTLQSIHKTADISSYLANTRDTLCYATNENQESTLQLLKHNVDLSIVAGGYNSSNTTHLVELISKKTKTFFINSENKISLKNTITHFNIKTKKEIQTDNFLPHKKCKIILTSGASCPDLVLENIIKKIMQIKKENINEKNIIDNFELRYSI